MDKQRRAKALATGAARWQASRLEGVVKNRGIKKVAKSTGMRHEGRLRKTVRKGMRKRMSRAAARTVLL